MAITRLDVKRAHQERHRPIFEDRQRERALDGRRDRVVGIRRERRGLPISRSLLLKRHGLVKRVANARLRRIVRGKQFDAIQGVLLDAEQRPVAAVASRQDARHPS